jgi:hypothetical protein
LAYLWLLPALQEGAGIDNTSYVQHFKCWFSLNVRNEIKKWLAFVDFVVSLLAYPSSELAGASI